MQLSFSLAFIAGLVSFLSPCVLPLVPAYIGYMGGRVTNTVAAQTSSGAVGLRLNSRFSTMLHGLAFVAGFTFVFVVIGLLGTAFVNQIGRQNINAVTNVIGRAGGLLIIFFGLHFMGVLPSIFNRILARRALLNTPLIGLAAAALVGAVLYWIFEDWLFAVPIWVLFLLWIVLGGAFSQPETFWAGIINTLQRLLYTDTRRQMVAEGHQSYLGSAVMGVIFSAGWTPCIGPIYGSILTMAAMGGDVGTAGSLLLAYSLGLGIPFIAAAFLLDGAQSILRHLTRHLHKIELVSGAFLVLIGVLVASGRLQDLSQNFATQFSDFSYNLEDCAVKLNQGELDLGGFFACVNGGSSGSAAAPAATNLAAAPSILALADTPENRDVGLNVGQVAPDFSAASEDGAAFTLADQRGKVVLLNFWATWCPPCRAEMPAFEQTYREQPDLVVVGVNNNETRDTIAGFRIRFGLTFPLLVDPEARVQELYSVRGYPTTYVLDANGVIVAQHVGALTAEQIAAAIAQARL